MMLRYIVLFGVVIESMIQIQGAVSLDSCRAMALRNNKQMLINATRIEGAEYQREVARAAYFPSIDFVGGYTYNQKELSIFDSDQMLPVKTFNPATGSYEFAIAKNPITGEPITSPDGRPVPQEVALIPKEAMTYNTHNLFFGALTLTQPVYMGGKIKALNRITEYSTQMAEMQHQRDAEDIIYNVDVAYWQVVSLDAKERLADREDIDRNTVFITYTTVSDDALAAVRDAVNTYGNFSTVYETQAGCTISCHCGPGTLGVLFVRK